MTRQLSIETRDWPARGTFRIARSALDVIPTVQVVITEGEHRGRAECRPYARYGQTVDSVTAEIAGLRGAVEAGMDHDALQDALPPGPARNALDCALWDLEAKRTGIPVWARLGLPAPRPRRTAFTLSIDTPDAMARAAQDAAAHTLLKVKLGADGILERLDAVTRARPDAELIVDANEAFDTATLAAIWPELSRFPILLLEQPLPAAATNDLPQDGPVICADESLHTADDLDALRRQGYRAVNVKLDKCGGLTAAHDLMQRARALDMRVMAGCMVGSSLAMAPMTMLESLADVIDLDGPLLLADDMENGLAYDGERVVPPKASLWG